MKLRIKLFIFFLFLILTINPLLNSYKHFVNSKNISLFLRTNDAQKVYVGRFPFFSTFTGYTTREPIQFQEKLLRLTLECGFKSKNTAMLIETIERTEGGQIIIVDKRMLSGIELERFLGEKQ